MDQRGEVPARRRRTYRRTASRGHTASRASSGAGIRRADATKHCAAALDASPPNRNVPLWLEIRLFDAEAQLRLGNKAGVGDIIDETLRVMETAQANADRWRGLALAAAARDGRPARGCPKAPDPRTGDFTPVMGRVDLSVLGTAGLT